MGSHLLWYPVCQPTGRPSDVGPLSISGLCMRAPACLVLSKLSCPIARCSPHPPRVVRRYRRVSRPSHPIHLSPTTLDQGTLAPSTSTTTTLLHDHDYTNSFSYRRVFLHPCPCPSPSLYRSCLLYFTNLAIYHLKPAAPLSPLLSVTRNPFRRASTTPPPRI